MMKAFLCILFILHYKNIMAEELLPVVSYGDLYMIDQTNDIAGTHRISVGGGLDTANPLRDIYNIQASYNYGFYEFYELGVIGKWFTSTTSSLKDRVDQEFDLIGLQVEGQKPRWATYLSFSVIPMKGRINFFRKVAIPFALALSVGPGVRRTDERGNLSGWFWTLQNRFYLSARYSLEINFTQEMEAAFESKEKATRSQLNTLFGFTF